MNLTDAAHLARAAMNAHGLGHWTFEFNRRRNAFGICNHTRRIISLSSILTEHATRDQVMQTVGHEIAHALTPGTGHGPVWKAKMREMGLRPDRCGEATEAQRVALAQTAKYILTCSVSGKTLGSLDRIVKSRKIRRGYQTFTRTYGARVCRCHGAPALYNGLSWENIT